MWIHVYPNWKMYFNSKIGSKSGFSYEIKEPILLIQTSRTCLWCPIMKWNEITIWIHVYPNWKTYFNSKIGNKKGLYYETKASISLIPMRRTCLWCPIMKRKEIVMWIHVYRNWKSNFNSQISNKTSFSYESKASISLIPLGRMCLWFPIIKRKEIIMWIHIYPNWKMNIDSKNGRKWSFSYETNASKSFIPTRRMWLWCPIMKWKEIIMWINVYPNWRTHFNSKTCRKRSFSY